MFGLPKLRYQEDLMLWVDIITTINNFFDGIPGKFNIKLLDTRIYVTVNL